MRMLTLFRLRPLSVISIVAQQGGSAADSIFREVVLWKCRLMVMTVVCNVFNSAFSAVIIVSTVIFRLLIYVTFSHEK